MSWLGEKLSESEPIAWGAAGLGLAGFAWELHRFHNFVDDALIKRLEENCGIHFNSRDSFRIFRSNYRKSQTERDGSFLGRFKRFAKTISLNPFRLKGELKEGALTFGPRVIASIGRQEVYYWGGGTALEMCAAFVGEHLGGDFLTVLVSSSAVGFAGAQLRRMWVLWYLRNELNAFTNPNSELCTAAKKYSVPVADATPLLHKSQAMGFDLPVPSREAVETSAKITAGAAVAVGLVTIMESLLENAFAAFGLIVPPYFNEMINQPDDNSTNKSLRF